MILVKNYLSETYGNGYKKKVFDNINEIKMINEILRKHYMFFERNFQGCRLWTVYKKQIILLMRGMSMGAFHGI